MQRRRSVFQGLQGVARLEERRSQEVSARDMEQADLPQGAFTELPRAPLPAIPARRGCPDLLTFNGDAMNAYAVIENGVVINTILWDGDTETWAPPDGCTMSLVTDSDLAVIGQPFPAPIVAEAPLGSQ